MIDVFNFDADYLDNEAKYAELRAEILGGASEGGSDAGGSGDEADESDGEQGEPSAETAGPEAGTAVDKTEANLVALRRTIYLTIQSSLDFEECAHKLLKTEMQDGQEVREPHCGLRFSVSLRGHVDLLYNTICFLTRYDHAITQLLSCRRSSVT